MNKSDIIVLFDIDNTLFNTEKLKKSHLTIYELYDEVKDTLKELSKIATLGVLSQGEIAFQNKKLQETDIKHYFAEEHKHIVEYKIDQIKDILGIYKSNAKIFFIDDWLDMLQVAKKSDPDVFTIWMKRGEYAHSQEIHSHFTPDATVTDLQEVISIIRNS
jgi:phosphoglycolate phosphatase-like HAD superfamily hydrolase